MPDKAAAEAFLRSRVQNIRHTGRPFLDHLRGVHDLLEQRGEPSHVCLAGLYHSVYGTNAFPRQAVPIEEHDSVAAVIGPEAERLAYIFCSCGRPRALIEAATCGPPYWVLDRRDRELIWLSIEEIRNLLVIELANLAEQGSIRMIGRVIDALHTVGK